MGFFRGTLNLSRQAWWVQWGVHPRDILDAAPVTQVSGLENCQRDGED